MGVTPNPPFVNGLKLKANSSTTAGANPAGLNDTFADALSLSQNTSQTVTGPISFSGAVTAPTRTAGDSSTNLATTAFVSNAVSFTSVATDNIALVSGGTNYALGNTITLAHGVVLAVTGLSGSAVSGWTLINRGSVTTVPPNPVTQVSTSGSGSGASFTLSWAPLAGGLANGTLTSNAGNLFIGGEQPDATFAGAESTFVGVRAGSGWGGNSSSNTAIGHNAGGLGAAPGASTGENSVYVGTDAGRNITGSNGNNTGIGFYAGRNVIGPFNTFVGALAGRGLEASQATGYSNTGVGFNALGGAGNMTTALVNTAIGDSAGAALTTGTGNVFGGYHAGAANTTGFNNILIGTIAGQSILDGAGHTLLGYGAGSAVVSSFDNTMVGQIVGQHLTGSNNTIVGSKAVSGTGGAASGNTVFGYQAALSLTSGTNNLVLGQSVASTTLTTGSNNIIIGVDANADVASAGTSNFLGIFGSSTTPIFSATNTNNPATMALTMHGLLTGTAGMTMSGGPVLFTVPDPVTNFFKIEGPGVWINAQNAVWSGAELDFASQLWCVGIHSGTSTSGTIYLTEFLIQSDEVQMGVTGKVDGFSFIHQFGGGNCAGHRNGMNVVLTQGAATRSHSLLAINPFFNALQVTAQFAHNEGGTGHVYSGGDPSAGQAFGMGAMVRLTSGATEFTSIAGAEFNVSVATGASTRSKVGIQIVKTSEDQQQGGDGEDCAIGIADQTGAGAYWNDGLAFGSPEAQWPFQTGSTLIKTYPQVFGFPTDCDTGIDFSSLHFKKSVLKAIGVNIDPSGVLQMANEVAIANFRMAGTATGMSIMNDGISTSWVFTVAAAGSGYNINDILTTATGGVYGVASINGSGGVTTVTQIVADISRSPPSNPLATTNTNTTKYTTGGSGCTLNLTWSAQNTLSLNPTAMTLIGPEAVHTRVVTASGAVFCTVADHLVVVNRTTSATANVWLPASPPQGMIVVVKDGKGDAATNNLIVTPDNSPTETIDGAASFTINTNYGRLITMNNGTEWNIISSS